MNYKRIFGIFIIFFILIGCISAINATQEKTIEGLTFNIPDGYMEDSSNSDYDFTDDQYVCLFLRHGPDTIIININDFSGGKLLKGDGEVEKTVNGIDGFYKPADKSFTYTEGNHIITISVPDESVLEDVIVNKDQGFFK